MSYLALLLFPVDIIRLLHRLFFAAVGDQIVNNLRLEVNRVKAKLFYKQHIPDNLRWKNCSSSQLVNKLSY